MIFKDTHTETPGIIFKDIHTKNSLELSPTLGIRLGSAALLLIFLLPETSYRNNEIYRGQHCIRIIMLCFPGVQVLDRTVRICLFDGNTVSWWIVFTVYCWVYELFLLFTVESMDCFYCLLLSLWIVFTVYCLCYIHFYVCWYSGALLLLFFTSPNVNALVKLICLVL